MKRNAMIIGVVGLLAVAGCSSYHGGSTDDYQTGYNMGRTGPLPSGGETVRPGMNSEDIRDPGALTRPLPPGQNVP